MTSTYREAPDLTPAEKIALARQAREDGARRRGTRAPKGWEGFYVPRSISRCAPKPQSPAEFSRSVAALERVHRRVVEA